MPDKLRERYNLDALRRAIPGLPDSDPAEPEPPDFVFARANDRLGIELTEFYLPPAGGEQLHQERQSLKDQIVERAHRIHHDAGGPPLYAMVYFSDTVRMSKRHVPGMAEAIATAILRAPMPQSVQETVELPTGDLPPFVCGVQIHPSIDGQDRLWQADAGGWVARISPDQIQAVVDAKSRTATRARACCDTLWLVIISDDFSLSAPAEISPEALQATYRAPFDRLLWLLPHSARAIDLGLEPAG